MKKVIILLIASLISSSTFAWKFDTLNISERSFTYIDNDGGTSAIKNIQCKAIDKRESLVVEGYISPQGHWNTLNRSFSGHNLRKELRKSDLLAAYLKFCQLIKRK